MSDKKEEDRTVALITSISGAVVILIAIGWALYQSGIDTGEHKAHAEMLMDRACKIQYDVWDEFMDRKAKRLALECHEVQICLHVDGKIDDCNDVTCDTGDRCDD